MSVYIYIKGMEMPTDCALLLKIFPDGRVGVPVHLNWMGTLVVNDAEAVPVQPHGRLIDADEMRDEWLINGENEYVYDTNAFLESIDNQPTVIPAEFGGAESK